MKVEPTIPWFFPSNIWDYRIYILRICFIFTYKDFIIKMSAS